jgi:ADP-heptose:LPS heptosyltransferase
MSWIAQPVFFVDFEGSRGSGILEYGVVTPALVKRADWVIANDSGPMHLAAALGVRVLGIFGPTDPRLFGPYPLNAPGNVVVQAPVGDLKLLSAKDVYLRFLRARARFK